MLIVALLLASCPAFAAGPPPEGDWIVDWIIVGGGAAGCTAASALVDGGADVLVIERGPSDKQIPSTQYADTWTQVVDQAVEEIQWTGGAWGGVAKVLGGGASVNDGYFFEETPEFVEEYLKITSNNDLALYFEGSQWLNEELTTPLPYSSYGESFANATAAAGFPAVNWNAPEGNIRYFNGSWVISSLFNYTDPKQTRQTPAKLLHERANNTNLQLLLQHTVTKVLFDGKRAAGVNVHSNINFLPQDQAIFARKGVIMSAGAIYTPQILQVSGVGEKALLDKLGVEQIVELPVGENFVDRLTWTVQIVAHNELDHFLGYTVTVDEPNGFTFESVGGTGVDTYMAVASLGLAPVQYRFGFLRPLMQFLMTKTPVAKILDRFSNVMGLMHDPKSRGTVQARSARVTDGPPAVNANFFSNPEDLENQKINWNLLRSIARQRPMNNYRLTSLLQTKDEVFPSGTLDDYLDVMKQAGLAYNTTTGLPGFLNGLFTCASYGFVSIPCPPQGEDKLGNFLKNNVLSTYHYFGTAAVGSVTEPGTFKVKGTESLFVADASVIPRATRINPVGTVMAIGRFVGTKLLDFEAPPLPHDLSALSAEAKAQEKDDRIKIQKGVFWTLVVLAIVAIIASIVYACCLHKKLKSAKKGSAGPEHL